MGDLPDKWLIKSLGEVCKTVKGKKPKDSGPASRERTVPYINIKAFESGQPEEFAAPGDYPVCERDDVLIVWDGARAGLIGRGVSGYIGSTLAKVYSDEADSHYLYYFLRSQYDFINSRTKGVGIPHVDPSIFNNIPFPIAPSEQQKRIVAEIEKQFSRLDEAVTSLKRVKANLKRYKSAVLKTAVEGKLTEEWRKEHPDVEPARKLLERILAERRAKWRGKGKYKEPAAPDTTSLPELPKGWVWATVEQLASKVQYGYTASAIERSPGVRFLRITDIQDGHVDWSSVPSCDISEKDKGELLLLPGDIVFARTGATVGKSFLLKAPFPESVFASYLIRISAIEPTLSDWLFAFFQSSGYWTQIRESQVGIGQPNVNGTKLQSLKVPLPPLAEQQRIVAEVERRLSFVEELETEVTTNLQRAERLRQSILRTGFTGKLVVEEKSTTRRTKVQTAY